MPKKKDAARESSSSKRGEKALKKTAAQGAKPASSSAKKKDTGGAKAPTVQKTAKPKEPSQGEVRAAPGRSAKAGISAGQQGELATSAGLSGRSQTRRTAQAQESPEAPGSGVRPEKEIAPVAPTDVQERFFPEYRVEQPEAPTRDLPQEYNDTRIVLLVRDPEWVFAYWEINDATRKAHHIPRNGHQKRMVIRMYKVNGRRWPEEAAHYFFDVDVSPYANNWYLRLPEADARWCAELGTFDEQGNFICIARSNMVATPRDRMSEETDSDWMIVEETYRKLYGLSGGYALKELRGSEEILRHLQKQIYPALQGEETSSGALVGASRAAVKPPAAEAGFWLQVHTELILYGATEPDATVTVQGRPVKLHPDGTFSLRYALPDGEQVLTVHGTSADGQFERTIVPVVKKTTKS